MAKKKQKQIKRVAKQTPPRVIEYVFPEPGYYELFAEPALAARRVYYITGHAEGNLWFDTRRTDDHRWVPLTPMCVPTPEVIASRQTEQATGVVRWFEKSSSPPEGMPPHG